MLHSGEADKGTPPDVWLLDLKELEVQIGSHMSKEIRCPAAAAMTVIHVAVVGDTKRE